MTACHGVGLRGIEHDVGAHLAAMARRNSFGSTAITCRAPSDRAIATANRPIGPHPITATALVAMSSPPPVTNAVCTALPKGSMIEATSGAIRGSDLPRVRAGSTT